MKIKMAAGMKFSIFFVCAFFLTSLVICGASYGEDLDDCGYPIVQVPAACKTCHGTPPVKATHPNNTRCYRCHGQSVDSNYTHYSNGLHQNGTVNYAVGCTSCHGWNLGTSPPQTLTGGCDSSQPNVSGHIAHRKTPIPAHQANCSNCHKVPLSL